VTAFSVEKLNAIYGWPTWRFPVQQTETKSNQTEICIFSMHVGNAVHAKIPNQQKKTHAIIKN
jgi:hypothetical protein